MVKRTFAVLPRASVLVGDVGRAAQGLLQWAGRLVFGVNPCGELCACQTMMDIVFQMMNFVLKMMNLAFKTMNFVLSCGNHHFSREESSFSIE